MSAQFQERDEDISVSGAMTEKLSPTNVGEWFYETATTLLQRDWEREVDGDGILTYISTEQGLLVRVNEVGPGARVAKGRVTSRLRSPLLRGIVGRLQGEDIRRRSGFSAQILSLEDLGRARVNEHNKSCPTAKDKVRFINLEHKDGQFRAQKRTGSLMYFPYPGLNHVTLAVDDLSPYEAMKYVDALSLLSNSEVAAGMRFGVTNVEKQVNSECADMLVGCIEKMAERYPTNNAVSFKLTENDGLLDLANARVDVLVPTLESPVTHRVRIIEPIGDLTLFTVYSVKYTKSGLREIDVEWYPMNGAIEPEAALLKNSTGFERIMDGWSEIDRILSHTFAGELSSINLDNVTALCKRLEDMRMTTG